MMYVQMFTSTIYIHIKSFMREKHEYDIQGVDWYYSDAEYFQDEGVELKWRPRKLFI